MNKDFWDKVDMLEELAVKATQGKWMYDEVGNIIRVDPERTYTIGFAGRDINYENNAKYIIAANPAMILDMIAEMRKMRRQVNWDLAALQAYGALPEDMEVFIDNESFAWHLSRIKTGIGKRLEFAEKRLEDCLRANEKLEKEADWLAEALVDNKILFDPSRFFSVEGYNELANRKVNREGHINLWREAARKAVADE